MKISYLLPFALLDILMATPRDIAQKDIIKECLLSHYKEIASFQDNIIRFSNQYEIIFDDKLPKTYEYSLANPDLEDSFKYAYGEYWERDKDSSRVRDTRFFNLIYGADKKAIESNLEELIWIDKSKILVHKKIATHLQNVIDTLERSPNIKELKPYLSNIGGTFNYRKIANSDNLSAHSYAIAIDINVAKSDYWLWDAQKDKRKDKEKLHLIPREIIDTFEKYGFIWGGKWWHYDSMHFEYRPEILCYAHKIRSKSAK